VTAVHAVLPDGIDDPARPSGGNVYDRRVCQGLGGLGWAVHEHPVAGAWPHADPASLATLGAVIAAIPDGAVALLDGLLACTAPDVLVPEARRLREVALVHMPLGHRPAPGEIDTVRAREHAVVTAASAIVTTSAWTQKRLIGLYALPAARIHVAAPGVDAAELAEGTERGGELLCVAAVTPDKGHDVLIEALGNIADLPWRCLCVGSLERDPGFADAVRGFARDAGLDERISFPGPRTGTALRRSYAAADLVVLPSRAETYGMVITEALARGLPVIASEVGGTPEALGHGAAGVRPGILVAPDDPTTLAAALRSWLTDAPLRARLRQAARQRRAGLKPWPATASAVAGVLAQVAR
jgi:glycosyltransferase involved in cell wall biosynthesis